MRAIIFALATLLAPLPAMAQFGAFDPCIPILNERDALLQGADDPNPDVRDALLQSIGKKDAYDDAVRRLDGCHAALQTAPPRQVGHGPRPMPK